jgi:hypothetical protein
MTEDHTMADINGTAEATLNEVPLADQVVNTRTEQVVNTLTEQVVNTKVTWDDRKMVTTFANVVNVLATREEVTILFGINQTWNTAQAKDLTVELSNRMVLTPYAAKRLLTLLQARMAEYEARLGPLTL